MVIKTDNKISNNSFLILSFCGPLFFYWTHLLIYSIPFNLFVGLLFCINRRDIFFHNDHLVIRRPFFPFIGDRTIPYSEIRKVRSMGLGYSGGNSCITISFKLDLSFVYMFKDDAEREQFFRLFLMNQVYIVPPSDDEINRLLFKLKKELKETKNKKDKSKI